MACVASNTNMVLHVLLTLSLSFFILLSWGMMDPFVLCQFNPLIEALMKSSAIHTSVGPSCDATEPVWNLLVQYLPAAFSPKGRGDAELLEDWIGLDLFNDDTCPSGHIGRPTQVNVSQSYFNSLNILIKLDYVVQVWGLVEVNCIISDRRIPLLAGIPLCKSRELSRRGYLMSQLCSIHHDIPVTLHTPGAYGQWSVFDHNGDK